MPSQADLAARLRISQASVSLALANSPRISASLRARVAAEAARIGYRPNPLVTALMATRKHRHRGRRASVSIAVLAFAEQLADAKEGTPGYFPRLVAGIDARAGELGVQHEYFVVDDPAYPLTALPRILHARGVNGLLFFPDPPSHSLEPPSISYDRFSCVKIGLALAQRPTVHTVSSDYGASIPLMLQRLAERGYARIGLALSRTLDWGNGNAASGQFLVWQQQQPARARVPLVAARDIVPTAGEIVAWYERHRPDAVIAYRPETRAWLRAAGYQAPRDYGHVQLSWHQDPTSAGFDQMTDQVGATAVDKLLRLIQVNDRGIPRHPSVTLVRGEWVDGPSLRTAAPRRK